MRKLFELFGWGATEPEKTGKRPGSGRLSVEQRGMYAQQALDNPIFLEAFRVMEDKLLDQWQNTLDDEIDKREMIFNRFKAIRHVEDTVTGFINEAVAEKAMSEKPKEASK